MKEKLQNLLLEYWMKAWKEQVFPAELKITNYAEWREFRQFWFEHPELDLQPSIDFYLATKENENK